MTQPNTTLPLDQLLLSDLNVRRTERDADCASLAEDIAARGLKQNLVVVPAHFSTCTLDEAITGKGFDWEGKFEVIAGGRRVRALRLLVADGRLPADHPVSVLIDERSEARETSLSENLHRVAMNPADEFDAFADIVAQQERLVSDHTTAINYTAKRFGVTVKHVEGRLRLATLATEILDALRQGTITLESAKAYAGSADQALQLKVFAAQAKSQWKPHDPATVRQNLRGETFALTHPLLKFVGLDEYRAAGGRTEVELFMGTEGEERGLDLKLVEQLAKAKAEPLVAPQAKADGFKSGMLASGYAHYGKTPKAPDGLIHHNTYYGELTKTQKKKAIGIYAINSDGTGLMELGCFKPEPKAKPGEVRDWDAEHRARERAWEIEKRAARLAVGSMNGTPLEGRAFWPEYNANPVGPDRQDDGYSLVAILISVPTADIEANKAEAEKALDAELAEQAGAAQSASEHDPADESQDDSGEFDDCEEEAT